MFEKKTNNIGHIRIAGKRDRDSNNNNNNKMERLNGEIRDREKMFRGLKKDYSSAVEGAKLYHSYIRPHMGLNGDAPADRAGIDIKGGNKWLTIIQNASSRHATAIRL